MSNRENLYPVNYVGSPDGRFEAESRVYVEKSSVVLRDADDAPLTTRAIRIEVTKPDPRLAMRVSLGFVPRGVGSDAAILPDLPAAVSAWVALAVDVGGGTQEVEDVLGTRAAPVPLVGVGLWGRSFEVDSDVDALILNLTARMPFPGAWMLSCRWVAKYPMSERDWRIAYSAMRSSFKAGAEVAT